MSLSEIKKNNFYEVDCIEGMKIMPDNSVDMVLTDIPYGVVNRTSNGLRSLEKGDADQLSFDIPAFLEQVVRVTKGNVYIFCSSEQVSEIRSFLIKAGLTTRHCIWEKTNPSPMNGQHLWLSGIENCIYAKKRGSVHNAHCKNGVWKFPNGRGKKHPTEKPLKLFEYLIESSSNEGMTIFDPCMGSGTACVAAKKLGRDYIGFEINKEYIGFAEERMLELKPNDEARGLILGKR